MFKAYYNMDFNPFSNEIETKEYVLSRFKSCGRTDISLKANDEDTLKTP